MKTYKVRSQTNTETAYTVQVGETFATCDCESFKFRKSCKHIRHILGKYYKPK